MFGVPPEPQKEPMALIGFLGFTGAIATLSMGNPTPPRIEYVRNHPPPSEGRSFLVAVLPASPPEIAPPGRRSCAPVKQSDDAAECIVGCMPKERISGFSEYFGVLVIRSGFGLHG